MLELTEVDINDIIEKNKIVIDFYTTWCGPCRTFMPIFQKWSDQFDDKVLFAKLNIDNAEEIAIKYGVIHIPCVVLFDHGKEVKRWIGIPEEADFVKFMT